MGAVYTLLSFGRRLDYCSRLGLDLSVCEYSMTDRQLSSMSAGLIVVVALVGALKRIKTVGIYMQSIQAAFLVLVCLGASFVSETSANTVPILPPEP